MAYRGQDPIVLGTVYLRLAAEVNKLILSPGVLHLDLNTSSCQEVQQNKLSSEILPLQYFLCQNLFLLRVPEAIRYVVTKVPGKPEKVLT